MTAEVETRIANLILGTSAAIVSVRSLIAKVGPSLLPVLIEGPTGCGKELVAEALHLASGRPGKLVSLNACAVPDSMFEREFFGHARGAFTGAISDKRGYLAAAHSTTLFLDEIGGLALASQVKLLRAIETLRFRPLGATSDERSDFRVVSATNEPIAMLMDTGRIRRDFAQRLGGIVIRLPPLRERLEDIAPLARHFGREASNGRGPIELSDCGLALMKAYEWPGNVRDLKRVVERAALLADGTMISASEIATAMAHGIDGLRCSAVENDERRRLFSMVMRCNGDAVAVALELKVNRATVYRLCDRLGISLRQVRVLARAGLMGSC